MPSPFPHWILPDDPLPPRRARLGTAARGLLAGSLWLGLTLGPTLRAHEDTSVEIADLTTAIAAAPADPLLYLRRAEMHRLAKHWHAAEPDYARAAQLQPGLGLVNLAWAAMWNDAGQPERALPLLNRFLEREPRNADGYTERARTRRMLKDWPAAATDYESAVRFSSQPSPEAFIDWAESWREGQSPGQALAVLKRGLVELGAVVSLEVKALELEEQTGRFEDALQRLNTMLARPGRKETLLVKKARVLFAADRAAEAAEALQLAQAELDALPATRRATAASQQVAADIQHLSATLAAPAISATVPTPIP